MNINDRLAMARSKVIERVRAWAYDDDSDGDALLDALQELEEVERESRGES